MLKLYKELKRRKVLKNLGVYGAGAFVFIQVADIVFERLLLPDWTVTFVIILAILGFPLALFLSWTYDLKREAETDDKSASGGVGWDKGSRKSLLPITGFLTIVGGAFWVLYSLGDISTGSQLDLQMGINKSIAVFNFENLTGQNEGDHFCSGISEHIRSVLTGIGKLDVKSRRAILNNNPQDLELDYYIEGTLSKIGERRNINITIVNAKSESNLWSGWFKFDDDEIVAYQDTIIQSILKKLEIGPIGNELTSSALAYKNPEAFKLIGEGVYHFDKQNYAAAIRAFDSVLVSDPENILASYHKANSYFALENFNEAMAIYNNILDRSIDINPIDWRMSIPERKDVHPILCDNLELIEGKDVAVMLLRGDRGCRLVGFNATTMRVVWENPIDDKFVSNPTIINNTVFLASSRLKREQKGEPTLYAYNISNGGETFIHEFPRDNQNQAVLFTILEEYNNISNSNSTILLSFNKLVHSGENYRKLALIETTNGSIIWEAKVDLNWGLWPDVMLINVGNVELLVLVLDNDIIALNNKTGAEVWRENFPGSGLFAWNQKVLKINRDEKYVAIWNPVSRKDEWRSHEKYEYTLNQKIGMDEFEVRMNRDVVFLNFTNGDLVAINYDGGIFNWGRELWSRQIGFAEKIWFQENISNHLFCLTENDSLLTINMVDGKIINSFAISGRDYSVYYDDSQNAMVLNNSEFLIGIDPINGEQLWKIKDNSVDRLRLIGNSVVVAKTVREDGLVLINNYNRDNGNLIWSENIDILTSLSTLPVAGIMCGSTDCAFCGDFTLYLEQYSDQSLLLVLHDEIIKVSNMRGKRETVQQKDVQLQIARTYEREGQFNPAIKEYNLLIEKDQMNQNAHWELANIYQKKDAVHSAAQSLINYYDLILPASDEGIITIQKLKDLSVLKWKKNIAQAGFDLAKIEVDDERVFLFIDNNIETYSINSSALIWRGTFGDKNTSIVSADVVNEKHVFFIKKDVPNMNPFYISDLHTHGKLDLEAFKKASKYSLAAVDKKGGNMLWDMPLDVPGESDYVWMGVDNNKIIIQSISESLMSISAYNIVDGKFLWTNHYDVSVFYTSYDLTPVFYNGNILLPLFNRVEYINVENGNVNRVYLDEDIDHILSFNKNSIQNNTMKFFIEEFENEYVVVDLDKNVKISGGGLDSENPELGMWMNNIFVDVSLAGIITAYQLPLNTDNEAVVLWQRDYNSPLKLMDVNEESLFLLDADKNYIYIVNASGKEVNKVPLLWPGKNVEITANYFIVQSANKLYVLPI